MIIPDIALQNLKRRALHGSRRFKRRRWPNAPRAFSISVPAAIPNFVHMQPKNEDEFVDMLWTIANYNSGPIAIRYPRAPGTGAVPKESPKLLEIGKAEVVQPRPRRGHFRIGQHV